MSGLQIEDVFGQSEYRCRLHWGRHGAHRAADRGDILVVVDVLSFTSSVATAIAYDGQIIPCPDTASALEIAHQKNAIAAVSRRDAVENGGFSLSPISYIEMKARKRVAVKSLNGAVCSALAYQLPFVFAASLLNANAVAESISCLLTNTEYNVTVLACGERWEVPDGDGDLRFAIEDYLGAGAVLTGILNTIGRENTSPEAIVCAGAFTASKPDITRILWECESGQELRQRGFDEDVRHASQLDMYSAVPILRDGVFVRDESLTVGTEV